MENDIKLDYSLGADERLALVQEILSKKPNPSPQYLEILSNYLIYNMTKEEKKEKKILTDNRMITVNKRETSYQGLVTKFENGEDGLYNLITEDKNIILSPKVSITADDIASIAPLAQLKDAIDIVEKEAAAATGKKKYLLKKQLIQMRQDQYAIKNEYKQPMYASSIIKSFIKGDFAETVSIGSDGEPISNGLVTFFNYKHISALLCNYSNLKENAYGNFTDDIYFVMEDLDKLIEKTLPQEPLLYRILTYKIDGKQNMEIQKLLKEEFNKSYTAEYISCLWRNKIPKLLSEQAKEDYLMWYYTEKERGQWKKCSRCGEIKLAHNRFFSKNSTSKDGYYSICKCCRNKKQKEDRK